MSESSIRDISYSGSNISDTQLEHFISRFPHIQNFQQGARLQSGTCLLAEGTHSVVLRWHGMLVAFGKKFGIGKF